MTRFLSLIALLWMLGFAAFMLTLPGPAPADTRTDAIVVPTGAAGRIQHGLVLIEAGSARRMLVSGVAPGVGRRELTATYGHARSIACCVDVGAEAVDTRSNAEETATWVRQHGYRSLRLVTSDWHMRRAAMELRPALDPGVALVIDGVPGEQRLGQLINEYNKLILRRIALWTGLGR